MTDKNKKITYNTITNAHTDTQSYRHTHGCMHTPTYRYNHGALEEDLIFIYEQTN